MGWLGVDQAHAGRFASGAACDKSPSSAPTRRVSADCEPARSTANSFSPIACGVTNASAAIAPAA